MLREQIPNVPALFNLFDSFVVFDGEIPILRLAEALENPTDLAAGLAKVPNLIYKQPGSHESTSTLPQTWNRLARSRTALPPISMVCHWSATWRPTWCFP
jgi:hypothetical protein